MKTPTATERALLALLRKPLVAAEVGGAVWEEAGFERRGRRVSAWGGGDYAAQLLLGRMRSAGLVRTAHDGRAVSTWELTEEGRRRAIGLIGNTNGLPINPPALPHWSKAELEARGVAFRDHLGEDSGMWFWTHNDRPWVVGPYGSKRLARAARGRFLKLTDGPQIRPGWSV